MRLKLGPECSIPQNTCLNLASAHRTQPGCCGVAAAMASAAFLAAGSVRLASSTFLPSNASFLASPSPRPLFPPVNSVHPSVAAGAVHIGNVSGTESYTTLSMQPDDASRSYVSCWI